MTSGLETKWAKSQRSRYRKQEKQEVGKLSNQALIYIAPKSAHDLGCITALEPIPTQSNTLFQIVKPQPKKLM